MLTLLGPQTPGHTCDGVSRRDFLRIGALGVGGLTLADLLRLQAQSASPSAAAHKAVIMVYLPGGPSHIDMYDMKPDAPAQYRGEFRPIRTNVSGMDICEHMPLQAKIADKLAILRGLQFKQNGHTLNELMTGIPGPRPGDSDSVRRPCFGSVLSKLSGTVGPVPPFVSLLDLKQHLTEQSENPAYLGDAHKPFSALGQTMQDLTPLPEVSLERLEERKALLRNFDTMRKKMDTTQKTLEGLDSNQKRALEMITSSKVRHALDLSREAVRLRDRYGDAGSDFLRARRLVEAGVSVVSVSAGFPVQISNIAHDANPHQWDNHRNILTVLRAKLPIYDQAVSALITDIFERGLDRDVAVVLWGEMGRTPLISPFGPNGPSDGRHHWPEAGCALIAGGSLRMGQVIGETDRRAERPKGRGFTVQHVLATLYHVLGINPDRTTLTDHSGRPHHLLDNPEKIAALI
jgi:hypothetical protein